MRRLFIDTNIVIDLLARRTDYSAAAKLFTLADKGEVELLVSSLTFANTNYILVKHEGKDQTLKILRDLELIVTITNLSGKVVQLALNDNNFRDFEDGLQYYSAIEDGAAAIITRNQKDFKASQLPVMNASQFLNSMEKID